MASNQTPGSGRRKRARPEDGFDSSPVPSPSTVAASAKRRRFNSVADSPRSTPKGFSAITSAIGGALGRSGRRKPVNEPNGTAAQSSFEVPASDDGDEEEPATHSNKPRKLDFGRLPKKSTSAENLYDVPDSDEELHPPRSPIKNGDKRNSATPLKAGSVNSEARSASARSTTTRQDGKGSRSTTKTNGNGTTPRKRGRPPKVRPTEAVLPEFPLAVKARIYGPTGRAASGILPEPPKLKGILSPQKRKAGRPVKIVIFNEADGVDSDVLEGDVTPRRDVTPRPTSIFTVAKSGSQLFKKLSVIPDTDVAEDQEGGIAEPEEGNGGEEEEDDDEVCVICSKPDSDPPNEIIFCEICDRGFHQKCYNVPTIPEGDWICRNCSQEDIVPDQSDITGKLATTPTDIPDIQNFEQHLRKMRRVLLDRCSRNRRIKLCGQTEAFDKAYQLVEQTVLAGEGNSMMVIGGRGCGKTTMIEEVLSTLRTEHAEEFHVIRLNGFIHTDDKLALKEIWRQLGKEMEIEDDLVNKTNNYADTMASLLALLSHPEEINGTEDGVTSKSVVFVIDEFELFATHARQTLLYNLFDIAQARKAPIAVLGLTTRIDVVESLEKRVKSRFSHRYVYLSLPKSLPAYWDICKQGLIVDKEDLETESFDTDLQGLYQFHDYWSAKIEALRQTPAFEDHLEYQYYTTKSVSAFLASCIRPLSALSLSSLDLVFPSSPEGVTLEPQEPKLQLLTALSDLELALLISAARLDVVAHTDTVNFAMAYDEYSAQMGRQRVQTASSGLLALGAGSRVWSRSVAVVAWERLVSLGLLIPAGIGGRSNAAHGGLEGRMWKMDVLLEEIPSAVELPGFLAKWCSQI
ncbi:origin recognition complex subunit 4 C-terminus-domain-containing protein [Xylaria arbuscula]|nr:origin recognition complex subunit 4 C-terminus-domain-containing protein [Xylaria arbuscula]